MHVALVRMNARNRQLVINDYEREAGEAMILPSIVVGLRVIATVFG